MTDDDTNRGISPKEYFAKYALPPIDLRRRLDAHERWAGGGDGVQITTEDLEPTTKGLTLNGRRLQGAQLDGCEFQDCDMIGIEFQGASLHGVTFRRCDLTGASFDGASLVLANFVDCEFDESTTFAGADLTGACIPGVTPPQQKGITRFAAFVPEASE